MASYAKLSWKPRSNVREWRIYRSVGAFDMNNLPAPIRVLGPGARDFYDTDNVTLQSSFWYLIEGVALDTSNPSVFSEPFALAPAFQAPSSLTLTRIN